MVGSHSSQEMKFQLDPTPGLLQEKLLDVAPQPKVGTSPGLEWPPDMPQHPAEIY